MSKWISVVGIGEDGLDGLAPATRTLVEEADVLVGGKRHLAKAPAGKAPAGKAPAGKAERIDWEDGFDAAFDEIARHEGRRVVVLASGDPLHFGVGANIVSRFGIDHVAVFPAPGAFSLAASRMGWPLADARCLTVHGRALEAVILHLAPGQRLLILSWDAETPAKLAEMLTGLGFGPSPVTVLENMGGDGENRLDGTAENWRHGAGTDLNAIAVECVAGPGAKILSRVPGLPEDAFEHDGLITKREVRAATLARLMPLPGHVLWDVGAGAGSVAIEWLRAEPSAAAVAMESNPKRAAVIGRNALALGVPGLKVIEGEAPGVFEGLKPWPDALFLGGGVSAPGLLEACWGMLSAGGRLVANGVTLEAEQRLLAFGDEIGGDLVRIGVSRAAPVGRLHAFRPLKDVTQLAAVKE